MRWFHFSLMLLPFMLWGQAATLKSDERALLFPTYAAWNPHFNGWNVNFHAWVFEIEPRKLTLPLARKALGFKKDELTEAELQTFTYRGQWFFADNERDKLLKIEVGEHKSTLRKTEANGHTHTLVILPTDTLRTIAPTNGAPIWLETTAYDSTTNSPVAIGQIALIPPTGVSVISDIDDTIKLSEVTNKDALLRNTFLKPFAEVPGMPELYQTWASNGVAFHYVSASPWQLFPAMEEFREQKGFPRGTFHMKTVRFRGTSFFRLFAAPDDYKRDTIEPILNHFPQRKFILVGDSGERDPEIYGKLARKFPDQIIAIYIRDVTGETAEAKRFHEAFEDIPRTKWQVFRGTDEMQTRHFNQR